MSDMSKWRVVKVKYQYPTYPPVYVPEHWWCGIWWRFYPGGDAARFLTRRAANTFLKKVKMESTKKLRDG